MTASSGDVVAALASHGLRDVDDSDLARWMRPQLSSVALPHFELGRRGVELLLGDGADGGVHLVPMPLAERGSIGPPRR